MQNRVVVITGASSGIGAATANDLARSSRLMLVARRKDRLESLAQEISNEGGVAHFYAADLAQPGSAADVIDATIKAFGTIDALVNNAGIFETAELGNYSTSHIETIMQLNVTAPMMLTQAALPHLIAGGGGWVINVSSVAASQIFPGCGVYGASKAALDQWTHIAREELRGQGVRVSLVSPGATYTEIWGPDHPSAQKMARAEDVAGAIAFCLNQPATASIDKLVVTPPGGAL